MTFSPTLKWLSSLLTPQNMKNINQISDISTEIINNHSLNNLEVFSRIKIVQRFQGTPLFLCCDNTITKNICVLNNNVVIFFSIKSPIFIKNAIIIVAQIYSCMEKQMFQKKMQNILPIMQNILPIDKCIKNTFEQLVVKQRHIFCTYT